MIVATLLPKNETQRLKALYRYQILDTPPEVTFDRITSFAARNFGVPFAKLSFVDRQRSWIKSCYGITLRQIQRSTSLAAYTTELNQVWQVPDVQASTLFAKLPLFARVLGIRFFASAPIVAPNGYAVGALSILDTMPRQLNDTSLALLSELAALVKDELEFRLGVSLVAEVGEPEKQTSEGGHPSEIALPQSLFFNSKTSQSAQRVNDEVDRADCTCYLDRGSDRADDLENPYPPDGLYRQIVETQTELVCRFQLDTTLTFVNEACCRYFGRSRTELIGQPFPSLFSGECRSGIETALASLTQESGSTTFEGWVVKANGEVIWQQWIGQAIRDRQGELREFQCIGRDITEQKQLAAQLHQRQATRLTFLKAIPDLILQISREGVCLDYQGSCNIQLPTPPSEWLGKNLREVLPAEFAKLAIDHLDLALKTQQIQVFEYQFVADGGYSVYETRAIAQGNQEGLVTIREIGHLFAAAKPGSLSLSSSWNILQSPAQQILQQYALGVREFQQAILSGQDLRGANLQHTNFSDALFNGAELSGINLQGANLSGANLRGAKLKGADLRNANLSFADLRGANCKGADLRNANLSWVLLSEVKLTGAILVGAILPNGVIHP